MVKRYYESEVVEDEPAVVRETYVDARTVDDVSPRSQAFSVVYYILNIVEALLLIRFVLKLLGANSGAGFTSGMYAITDPLVAPFQGIFPTAAASGSVLEWSTIIAMIVYALIAFAIVQLLRVATTRRHVV